MQPLQIQTLKRTISAYTPPLFWAIRHSRRMIHEWRNQRLQTSLTPWKAKFIQQFGFVVQGGLFAGMTYHACDPADAYLPLLTGAYEAQTHAFIETALSRDPTVIVDVGCEAGYVAIGLALRAPFAKVIGFDIDPKMQEKCRSLARLNHVEDRVVVEGECAPQRLNELCVGRPLVFCDCEGYEFELLDPEKAPNLKTADIIVELHDFRRFDVDITPTVASRFAATHDIEIVGIGERRAEDYPSLAGFPEAVRAQALDENRVSYQQWAYLRAKDR